MWERVRHADNLQEVRTSRDSVDGSDGRERAPDESGGPSEVLIVPIRKNEEEILGRRSKMVRHALLSGEVLAAG